MRWIIKKNPQEKVFALLVVKKRIWKSMQREGEGLSTLSSIALLPSKPLSPFST